MGSLFWMDHLVIQAQNTAPKIARSPHTPGLLIIFTSFRAQIGLW